MKIRFQKNYATLTWDMWFVWDQNIHYDYKITVTKSDKPVDEKDRRHLRREPDAQFRMDLFADELLPAFLEGLAEAGFLAAKPGDIAHVDSLKYHLEDMRRLVFDDGKQRMEIKEL